ncbi:hypothetical protein [Proteiniphilum propionicum]|nr:hypothetical protein [Proteiniphilum propionicum]MDD4632329.1 hypothetical protein [Proteiniphilum sp.]
MKLLVVFLLIFTLCSVLVTAGEKEAIYRAYLNSDMATWKQTI